MPAQLPNVAEHFAAGLRATAREVDAKAIENQKKNLMALIDHQTQAAMKAVEAEANYQRLCLQQNVEANKRDFVNRVDCQVQSDEIEIEKNFHQNWVALQNDYLQKREAYEWTAMEATEAFETARLKFNFDMAQQHMAAAQEMAENKAGQFHREAVEAEQSGARGNRGGLSATASTTSIIAGFFNIPFLTGNTPSDDVAAGRASVEAAHRRISNQTAVPIVGGLEPPVGLLSSPALVLAPQVFAPMELPQESCGVESVGLEPVAEMEDPFDDDDVVTTGDVPTGITVATRILAERSPVDH